MAEPLERLSPRPLAELVQRVEPLGEGDDLAHAADRIAEAGGGLPVVDAAGRLVGYLAERDLLGGALSRLPAAVPQHRVPHPRLPLAGA